tara:strand:+ start:1303 stop:1842 length:540 start_codon:yes stop_codon:yes gene_type:complete
MKKILFLLAFAFIGSQVYSQESIVFTKVVKYESLTKNEVFVIVNDWFASNYGSANEVIQMSDKESGKIIGKALFSYSFGKLSYTQYEGRVNYTIKITIKENRFKIDVNSFIHNVNPGNASSCELGLITNAELHSTKGISKRYHNKVWLDIKQKSEVYSNNIFNSIEDKIVNYSKDDDDW